MNEEEWVTDRKNRWVLEIVTIGGEDFTVDKNDVFVAIGTENPELQPDIVEMFKRAGDKLAMMKYPANLASLPVDERTIDFVAGIIAVMPVETKMQQDALDRAIAKVTSAADKDEKTRAIDSLADEALEKLI